jgi:hypothetical protein
MSQNTTPTPNLGMSENTTPSPNWIIINDENHRPGTPISNLKKF